MLRVEGRREQAYKEAAITGKVPRGQQITGSSIGCNNMEGHQEAAVRTLINRLQ